MLSTEGCYEKNSFYTSVATCMWFCLRIYLNKLTANIRLLQWLSGIESACNAGDAGSIPELRRSPGGGHGNPLQYSCLENPMHRSSLVGYHP